MITIQTQYMRLLFDSWLQFRITGHFVVMITSLVVYLVASTVVASAFEFAGPSSRELFAFFPLDAIANLHPMYGIRNSSSSDLLAPHLGHEIVHSRAQLRSFSLGPYGMSGTSYSSLDGHHFLLRLPESRLPKSFTLSLFLHKSSQNGSLLNIPPSALSSGLNVTFNGSTLLVAETTVLNLVDNHVSINMTGWHEKWTFIAFVYGNHQHRLDVFNTKGERMGFIAISGNRLGTNGLEFGKMHGDDQLSCLQIYEGTLTATEIQNLPCVCKTRGKCSDGRDVRPREYLGPHGKQLIGYLPLVLGLTDMNEMTKARGPDDIADFSLVKATGGPLSQTGQGSVELFSALGQSKRRFVSFWHSIGAKPSNSSFTLSFYVIQKAESDEILLDWGGMALVSSGDHVNLHIGESKLSFENRTSLRNNTSDSGNTWMFVALTYDADSNKAELWNEEGQPSGLLVLEKSLDTLVTSESLAIGPYAHGSEEPSANALMCLSLHSVKFTSREISALHCTCVNTIAQRSQRCTASPTTDFEAVEGFSLGSTWLIVIVVICSIIVIAMVLALTFYVVKKCRGSGNLREASADEAEYGERKTLLGTSSSKE